MPPGFSNENALVSSVAAAVASGDPAGWVDVDAETEHAAGSRASAVAMKRLMAAEVADFGVYRGLRRLTILLHLG